MFGLDEFITIRLGMYIKSVDIVSFDFLVICNSLISLSLFFKAFLYERGSLHLWAVMSKAQHVDSVTVSWATVMTME